MTARIAAVQWAPTFSDPASNLNAMAGAAREAFLAGAKLAIFPEASVAGYCFSSAAEALEQAETVPGPSTEAMQRICAEREAHVVYGTIEREGDVLRNTAVLVGPKGLIGKYHKAHLPFLGVDRFVTPGTTPFTVFEAGPLRIGMLICYDGSFPEATRCLMLAGADLVCLPTNWPTGGLGAAEYLTNARAYENHLYFAAVNRIGAERGFKFIGRSRICGPYGDALAEAWHDRAEIIYADINPQLARNKHLVRVPGEHEIHRTNDRRPELYGTLTEMRRPHCD
ncbi:MAG TPA: carbon-nitrogen hydrolase family protein [Planctomycetia bacterium]|nr:carbon-nitrogen hydrolase family protein [Planctomycetia bacterium]